MLSPFYEWKRALSAADKGPLELPPIRRGIAWTVALPVTPLAGEDLTGSTLRGDIATGPHATPVLSFAVTDPEISVDGVATFELLIADTGLLPEDDDGDGARELVYDLLLTPSGGVEELLVGGTLRVFEGITA